jgi:hypothetical protein
MIGPPGIIGQTKAPLVISVSASPNCATRARGLQVVLGRDGLLQVLRVARACTQKCLAPALEAQTGKHSLSLNLTAVDPFSNIIGSISEPLTLHHALT